VERVGVLAREFGIGETLPADLGHSQSEALRVVHVLAVVEAKHLFVEVAEKMKRFHRNIRPMQAALYQRPKVLKGVCVYAAIHVFDGMVNHFMVVVAVQADIGLQSIGLDGSACFDFFSHEWLHVVFAPLLDDARSHAPTALNESDHNRFVVINPASEFSFAALVHVSRFAADESLVNFDFAVRASTELASKEIILHGLADALQHEPCRFLMNSNCPRQFVTADAVLAIGQHPKCRHPLIKGDRRIFHDRANLDRELLLALVAKPDAASLDKRVLRFATARTGNLAARPAIALGILKSAGRIGEIDHRFLQRFRSFKSGVHTGILH